MKIGLIGWPTTRGLGTQSLEFARAMQPERTMLLSAGPSEFDADAGQFPGEIMHVSVGADHRFPELKVREWLAGLDVVFAAESFTDWRMIGWANDAGVATVCQTNAEFFRHGFVEPNLPHPTQWWAPTPWRLEHLPPSTVVVPVPVALDRFSGFRDFSDEEMHTTRLRVLHVAGRRAVYDRNGTDIVSLACQYVQEAVDVVITTQDAYQPDIRLRGPGMRAQVRAGNILNYWDLYSGFDLLLMPRRYGGLSLVVQEAMAAGLGVIMPGCSPNEFWPIMPLPVTDWSRARMPGGEIDLAAVSPRKVAEALDCLAVDRLRLAMLKDASRTWAVEHSWEVLAPLYHRQLEDACNRRIRS